MLFSFIIGLIRSHNILLSPASEHSFTTFSQPTLVSFIVHLYARSKVSVFGLKGFIFSQAIFLVPPKPVLDL